MQNILSLRRILVSAGIIIFAATFAAGATGAFFSDTETSTGNTFAAGDIDLQIDNESYVTNTAGALVFSPNTSWAQTNLTNQKFFNFSDVKPGDIGEDTISVHVGSNDGWACMALDLTATPENTLVDPETDAGDAGPALGDNGELQNYLHFTFWKDDGDNVFEVGETAITSLNNVLASALQGQWHPLADSANLPALVGGSTNYIAKAWCFGTLTPAPVAQDGIGHTGTGIGDSTNGPLVRGTGFTCSGVGNQNDAQTDGITMDVQFQAQQSRNNAQFLCSSLPTAGTGTLIVNKVIVGAGAADDFDYQIDGGAVTPFEVDGSNSQSVAVGSHSVVEVAAPGYTTTYSNSLNGNADCNNLAVPNGGSVTCTITNTQNI